MNKVKEVWDWLKRYGTDDLRVRFKPIYLYIQKLEKENEKLRAQCKVDMFKDCDKVKAIHEQGLQEIVRNRTEKKEYYPLQKRLKILSLKGKQGSQEWLTTLRWNKLSEEQALELAGREDETASLSQSVE
jgi:hypothetical protein